jgi:hypothetical protein
VRGINFALIALWALSGVHYEPGIREIAEQSKAANFPEATTQRQHSNNLLIHCIFIP